MVAWVCAGVCACLVSGQSQKWIELDMLWSGGEEMKFIIAVGVVGFRVVRGLYMMHIDVAKADARVSD